MRISLRHMTRYRYDPPANRVAIRLRLFPAPHEGQRVVEWDVSVNGATVAPLFTDGFGDQHALWHAHEPCDDVLITAQGVIETADRSGVIAGLLRRPPPRVFLRTTELTEADDAIRALANAVSGASTLDRMHALSEKIAAHLSFQAGTTGAKTTAGEAWAGEAGVCQDFSHVMIAAARSINVPARYIVGYLLADEDQAEVLETHAWVEVFVDDLGWVGFDPSNGVCPTERYVRLSCGLDAHSAAPIRGSVGGNSDVELEASVAIEQAQQ